MHFSKGLYTVGAFVSFTVPTYALNYNVSLNSQTHLAFAGPDGMVVSWNTYNQIEKPTVKYGLSPNKLNLEASSIVSVTYDTSLTFNNHVKLTKLLPYTTYWYMPTSLMESGEKTGPFSFKTSRTAGDTTPYSVALVVDMGTFGPEGLGTTAGKGVSPNNILKPGETNTIQSITAVLEDIDFLLHPGDIAYADTWVKEARTGYINATITLAEGYKAYESILDDFYDQMTPITTVKPYMVGPGNHEANCDNGGNGPYTTSICMPGQMNFTGYRNHFRMPSDESGGLENFWFSFDSGMVHYVQIDTETDLGHGLVGPDEPLGGTEDSGPFGLMNQQINWLKNDLANVDRSKTPWVVVTGHRPWYSSGSICPNCSLAFEPLFLEYGVDLYISGHFHVYERMTPIANNVSDPNGLNNPTSPWYIVNGAAGHYDGLDSFTLPFMPYHEIGYSTNDGVYGWSKLTFHNCTHLTQSFIASNNGSVLDSATLYKDRICPSPSPSNTTSSSVASSTVLGNSSATRAPISMTTSVVFTTQTLTVKACPSTVTNCPANSTSVVTSTIALYTTTCPVKHAISVSTTPRPTAIPMTTSIVYATKTYTIIACPFTVTDCPARSTKLVTSTIPLYTTICPVSVASSKAAASAVSIPSGATVPADTATKAATFASGGVGSTKTTTGGQLQVTSGASANTKMVSHAVAALFGFILAGAVLF